MSKLPSVTTASIKIKLKEPYVLLYLCCPAARAGFKQEGKTDECVRVCVH